MMISSLKIKNYRSLESLNIKLKDINVLYGPNSSGKSNILRAINLAFSDISQDKRYISEYVRNNLSLSKMSSSASIQVEINFIDAPLALFTLAQEKKARTLSYKFKLTKSGNLTRKLGKLELDESGFRKLLERFSVVYVPTIRDMEKDGLEPFKELFKYSIQSVHGGREMKEHLSNIKTTLSRKASIILGEQRYLAQSVLNAKAIELNTDHIKLDGIYENMTLKIKDLNRKALPLEYLGTGHQSAVIINLYKQFGESAPGKTLYLFEEPDAHLHPPTIRSIGSELDEISNSAQIIVTTHSPILLSHLGLDKVINIQLSPKKHTELSPVDLAGLSEAVIKHRLLKYGLRITEALFSRLVVIVEGKTDSIVIGRLMELRKKKSYDQMDIIITPSGGKENIVEIAEILQLLKVKWFAIFDFDAALSTSSIPLLNGDLDLFQEDESIDLINHILSDLDTRNKRGRKARTQLNLIKSEIENGPPTSKVYEDSTIQKLMEKVINISTRQTASLKSALKNNKVQLIRKILGTYNIWLIRPDLENILLGNNDANLAIIAAILKRHSLLDQSPSSPQFRNAVINRLHELANNPEVMIEIVDAIDNNSGFNRTDINIAIKAIIEQIK